MLHFEKVLLQAIIAYKNKNYSQSAHLFIEYFKIKEYGVLPDLDEEDHLMLLNMGNALLYSGLPAEAINVYEKLVIQFPKWSDLYFMLSVANYKLRNFKDAELNWNKSKELGNPKTQEDFKVGIQKFTKYDS